MPDVRTRIRAALGEDVDPLRKNVMLSVAHEHIAKLESALERISELSSEEMDIARQIAWDALERPA